MPVQRKVQINSLNLKDLALLNLDGYRTPSETAVSEFENILRGHLPR